MEEIINALELKKQLDALRPIDREQEARIMQKFRLDWNYHSNNLEGNSLTYGETKALIMHGITAQGKPLKDHFEVTGHNEAINWVIDVVKGDYPLTEHFIRELHTLLLKESYEVDAITPDGKPTKKRIAVGRYKSSPNHVQTKTGEIFYFATPEETPAKMSDLMVWYNEKIEDSGFNPILLAAEFHYKFIRIHPFDDGNGRTARILMNFILMKFGYPPVIIKTEDKANYFAALQLADVGQLEAFVNYIAQNLIRSLEIMIAGAKGESIEEPDDIDKEIALLEKRLNGLGDISYHNKTTDDLYLLFDSSIRKFVDALITEFKKLTIFYMNGYPEFIVKKTVYVEVEHEDYRNVKRTNKYSSFEEVMQTGITDEFNQFTIKFHFKYFNRVGFGEFNFTSEYNFIFSELAYSLTIGTVVLYQKPYNAELTESDIINALKRESKRHTIFIEQKISEKEKGQ
ncbi:Fic family protein [Flavobacterium subsaxonicum]|uniref:Fic family protein n=1 Tax=Flavobacterium subsaxonicum TaxID=426226 RepID=UPI00041A60A7|nr:Fic family protein [Flavobacterium subsaxonicum]